MSLGTYVYRHLCVICASSNDSHELHVIYTCCYSKYVNGLPQLSFISNLENAECFTHVHDKRQLMSSKLDAVCNEKTNKNKLSLHLKHRASKWSDLALQMCPGALL